MDDVSGAVRDAPDTGREHNPAGGISFGPHEIPRRCAAREGGVRNRRPRVAVLVALSIVFSTLAVPALADVSPSDIRAAESLAGEAAARLRVAEAELAAAERHLERLEESLVSVGDRLERQDAEIVEGRADARDRIARMYMTAGGSDTSGLLGLTSISDLPAHLAYLGALADQDREFVNRLAATRADLERLSGVIEAAVGEQTEVVSDLAEVVEVRRAELEAARARGVVGGGAVAAAGGRAARPGGSRTGQAAAGGGRRRSGSGRRPPSRHAARRSSVSRRRSPHAGSGSRRLGCGLDPGFRSRAVATPRAEALPGRHGGRRPVGDAVREPRRPTVAQQVLGRLGSVPAPALLLALPIEGGRVGRRRHLRPRSQHRGGRPGW